MTSNLLANYKPVAPRHIVAAALLARRPSKQDEQERERLKASTVPTPDKPLKAEVGRHE